MTRRSCIKEILLLSVAPALLLRAGPGFRANTMATATGGGCTTTKDSITTATDSSDALFSASARTFNAFWFTAGSSYTLCGFDLDVYKHGSPTMNVTPYIYANSTNKPAGTPLATGTLVAASTLPSAAGSFFKFTGFSLAVTNGTVYWAVLGGSATDGTNYVSVDVEGSVFSGAGWPGYNTYQISTDGATWSNHSNEQGRFHTFA